MLLGVSEGVLVHGNALPHLLKRILRFLALNTVVALHGRFPVEVQSLINFRVFDVVF